MAAKRKPSTGFLIMEGAPGAETVINGKRCLYFGGTGYFGLHGHPEILRAGAAAFALGTHSATTRTGFGNNPILLDVEAKLADFFGTGAAVYYPSGYLNGLFLVRSLADRYDVIFADEMSHFSLKDGAAAAAKKTIFFRHRDPSDLRKKLGGKLRPGQTPLVLTDGVFPTFGKIAPVPEILRELESYNGLLALDDAHGAGILGIRGRGTLEHFGLAPAARVLAAGTLSKAFGGHGGFIAGSKSFIKHVRESVGAYAGTTPTPTPIAAASAKGIALVKAHPEWRMALRKNTIRLKFGLKKLGFPMNDNPVPIAAWTLRTASEMMKVQKALMEMGIALAYLKYVGAPAGGVLRATVFSTHTSAQIDRLLCELAKIV